MVMEGYKYPTLSLVVPLYNQLMSDLKACSENSLKTIAVRAAALAAYDKLNKYYEKTSTCNIIATICDPRLKLQYFERNGWSNCDGENLIATIVKPA